MAPKKGEKGKAEKGKAEKAEKTAKAVKGGVSKKVKKIRTKVRFYRPKTLIKSREPKYPRKSVESRGDKLDKYRIIQCPVDYGICHEEDRGDQHVGVFGRP